MKLTLNGTPYFVLGLDIEETCNFEGDLITNVELELQMMSSHNYMTSNKRKLTIELPNSVGIYLSEVE